MFSLPRTEVYTNTIRIVLAYSSSVVDNFVTTTRLANKTVFTNAELINTSLQQARISASQQQCQHKEDNNNKEKLNSNILSSFFLSYSTTISEYRVKGTSINYGLT